MPETIKTNNRTESKKTKTFKKFLKEKNIFS